MGWTLDEVRALDVEDFDAVLDWATKRAEKKDTDSMDMDAVIDAKRYKERQADGTD